MLTQATKIPLVALFVGALALPAASEDVCREDCRLLRFAGFPVTWDRHPEHKALRISVAFVQAVPMKAGANCGELVSPRFANAKSNIDFEAFAVVLQRALSRWEAAANVLFDFVSDPTEARLIVGAQTEPHGIAFVDLDTKLNELKGHHSIQRAAICLNDQVRWKMGFDGDLTSYSLEHVLVHEIGHVLGLDHPSARGHVMSFRYGETIEALTPGDIAGVQHLYGLPQAFGRSAATAPTSAFAPTPAAKKPRTGN